MSDKISDELLNDMANGDWPDSGFYLAIKNIAKELLERRTAEVKPVNLPEPDHETEDGYKYFREDTVFSAIKAAGGTVEE